MRPGAATTGESYGRIGGEDVRRLRPRADGIEADVLSYGGIVAALRPPDRAPDRTLDRAGRMEGVVLGRGRAGRSTC